MTTACPVCSSELVKTETRGDRYFFECPRCGPFSLSGTAKAMLPTELERIRHGSSILSHALYKMTRREQWIMLKHTDIQRILSQTTVPQPQQQLENLILWFGHESYNYGLPIPVRNPLISAVGATDSPSLGYIIEHAIRQGLLDGQIGTSVGAWPNFNPLLLTFQGWELYEELQRGHSTSRIAFMAMQFGDTVLDAVYASCFKPAVGDTGFTLKKLDEGQPAGLIDDRLRVEIRQARFLIADLTHQNRGAYWEAGFAEGLGKPVIYTCRKDVFEDKAKGPHFDTNHHLTVVWESDKLDDASIRLRNTIRATLPDEAILTDKS